MKHRLAVILPVYFVLYVLCYYGAYLLRFDFNVPEHYLQIFRQSLPVVLILKLGTSLVTNEWRRTLRYATLTDILHLIVGATAMSVLLYASSLLMFVMFDTRGVPRGVVAIDWALTILAFSLLRASYRLYNESLRPLFFTCAEKRRTLIYGANQEGIGILRALQATQSEFRVVGFVDKICKIRNSLVAGVPVHPLGTGWANLSRRFKAQHVLIPGTVSASAVREILQNCSKAGLKTHIIPTVHEIVDGRYKVTVRDVTISDLLRREPAQLDMQAIRNYICNRRILVTGAAGSIGAELCRQLLALEPEILLLADQSETGIFTISNELPFVRSNIPIRSMVADVTHKPSMERIFGDHAPQLVFHAAAYKHVPLMEQNPQEAIRNNVFGTRTVADLAEQAGVERFVLISTDKAVRPSSVMGATKLIAERYLQALSAASNTRFMTVRFGNVLNSAGSVVPTFRRQIEAGGPLTVTHAEMQRYFMTIPEAVQLVLQSGAVGSSGDVLILDMGEPVKIVDLAKDMIFLSGLRYPDDIDIVFTGIRPGEKLFEELFYKSEQDVKRVHEKIFCAPRQSTPIGQPVTLQGDLARLTAVLQRTDVEARNLLCEIIQKSDLGERQSLKPAA